jgi:hypothetical protein
MKAYIVVSVAMEIEGRVTAVRLEKGFKTSEAAEKYMASVPKTFADHIKTETSTINCWCERNVQEVELED